MEKIALGGGCHWCTEAVFQSLVGVEIVEQGFVASQGKNGTFSEAVILHFDPERISLSDLIEIHLHTHASTSDHSMRTKYRSAIYTFSIVQENQAERILDGLQSEFGNQLITKVYPFRNFKSSDEQFKNYYLKNPKKPFCETFIDPKLIVLLQKFSDKVNLEKIGALTVESGVSG